MENDKVEGAEETTLASNENQGNENNESNSELKFDASAFTQVEESSLNEGENDATKAGDQGQQSSGEGSEEDDSTNDHVSWDHLSSSTEGGEGEQDQSESDEKDSQGGSDNGIPSADSDNDLGRNAESGESEGNSEGDSGDYTQLAKTLGVEPDKVVESIQSLRQEVEELRSYRTQSFNNDKIENWGKLKTLKDEDLVRKSLTSENMSSEDAEKQIAKWSDEGMLDVEANKVRRRLDNAIAHEQQTLENQEKERNVQIEEQNKKNLMDLRNTIDSTDEFFGMKMVKDESKLPQARTEHLNYVTDGKFAEEIGSSSKNLLEVAWLWKHKDAILSQLKRQGVDTGRKQMLDMIENTNQGSPSNSKQIPPNPETKKAFDSRKFTGQV